MCHSMQRGNRWLSHPAIVVLAARGYQSDLGWCSARSTFCSSVEAQMFKGEVTNHKR